MVSSKNSVLLAIFVFYVIGVFFPTPTEGIKCWKAIPPKSIKPKLIECDAVCNICVNVTTIGNGMTTYRKACGISKSEELRPMGCKDSVVEAGNKTVCHCNTDGCNAPTLSTSEITSPTGENCLPILIKCPVESIKLIDGNTNVTQIQAQSPCNGNIQYEIDGDEKCSFEFMINETTGAVYSKNDVSHVWYTRSPIHCIINAIDVKTPEYLSTKCEFNIDRLYKNDDTGSGYLNFKKTVNRNITKGSEIIKVTPCDDYDSVNKSNVEYKIDDDTTKYFSINEKTGIIYLDVDIYDVPTKDIIYVHANYLEKPEFSCKIEVTVIVE